LRIAQRWRDLFAAGFDLLLYDLTSTYFESPPPLDAIDKRRYGCSRNKRGDCVHVLIALTVKPDRLPLAYEVPAGNTVECTTLPKMLRGDRSAMWQGAAHPGDRSHYADRGASLSGRNRSSYLDQSGIMLRI